MTARRTLVLALALLALVGCGPAKPSETLRELFDTPEAEQARERAPDLFADAHRARDETARAQGAEDEVAAADHATRARLLLAAAVAESERIALEERRLAAEARTRRAIARARRDEVARREVLRGLELELAARVAEEQGRVAFTVATEDEARRYRATAAEREQMHREAAAFLEQRARLVLAAAEAMGADAAEVAALRARLDEDDRGRTPAALVEAADRDLRQAYVLLGRARGRGERPDRDARAALVARATELRFGVEQHDRGLVVSTDAVFTGRATRPARGAVERLSELLLAHPIGPVRLEVHAAMPASPARQRLVTARAEALAAALAEAGVPRDRLRAEGVAENAASESTNRVDVVFTAYGPVPVAPQ